MDWQNKATIFTVLYHREDKGWILENKAFRTCKRIGFNDCVRVDVHHTMSSYNTDAEDPGMNQQVEPEHVLLSESGSKKGMAHVFLTLQVQKVLDTLTASVYVATHGYSLCNVWQQGWCLANVRRWKQMEASVLSPCCICGTGRSDTMTHLRGRCGIVTG